MSDVSGIPYMGPMGQGNFFAPQFSYNPQLTAGQIQSNYMPEAIQNQNVFNNLYGGGANAGFGRQTDYYSQLAANQLSGAVYSQGGSNGTYNLAPAGTFSDYNAGGAWPTAGQRQNTAIDNFVTGGGGYNFPSIPNYSGGLEGLWGGGSGLGNSGFSTRTLQDWAGNWNAPQQQSMDWSSLFGGAAKADPFPGMSMPGGMNSPMATPQPQQQPQDYSSLFGRGAGGTGGAPQSTADQYAPAPMPSAADQGAGMFGGLGGAGATPGSSAIDWSKLFGGGSAKADPASDMSMPGGLNSPMTTRQQQPVDYGSLFGQSVGGSGQLQPVQEEGASFNDRFGNLTNPITGQEPQQPRREASAADIATQARERATGLLDPYDQPSLAEFQRGQLAQAVAEGEAGRGGMVGRPQEENPLYPTEMPDKIPLPQARPEGADAPRPAASIGGTGTPAERAGYEAAPRPSAGLSLDRDYRGRDVTMVEQRLRRAVEGGATFLPPGYTIQPTSGYLGRETSAGQHSGKHAEDFRIIGPDGPIPNEGHDYSGMYTLLGRGVKTWVQQNDPTLDRDMRWGAAFETKAGSGSGDTMHFDTGMAHGTPYQGNLNPNSRWVTLQPLSAAEQGNMPAYIPLLGANQVPLEGRVPTGTGSSYLANPVRFGGDADMPTAGQLPAGVKQLPNGDIVSSNYWNIPKEGTPEWNQQVYEPALSGGIMRRPETQTTGGASSYNDFRRSDDVVDRRDDQLGRDALAALKATPAQYYADPEQAGAASNPMSIGLGLGDRDLPVPQGGSAAAMVRPQGIAGDEPSRDQLAQLMDKYGPEALWAAQGQSQFPQGQTQPLGGDDVSRMPYTQQSPVPGASFPVQLYDDPRYGQASAPTAEAPPQPFPGASEVTQQPYQPPRPDEGNPFFSPVGGADFNDKFPAEGAFAPSSEDLRQQLAGEVGRKGYLNPQSMESSIQDKAAAFSKGGPKSMTFEGGFSDIPDLSSKNTTTRKGVGPEMDAPTPEFMQKIANAESTFNPSLHDPKSQYKGLYQLNDAEFKKYGGQGSIYDSDENAKAATAKMVDEGQKAQDALGRALTPVEQYMVHQQGLYGALAHLSNPDGLAWKNFQDASGNSEKKSKEAVWGNLTKEMKAELGSVDNLTSRDYVKSWEKRYNAL